MNHDTTAALRTELKALMVETLMLQVSAAEIGDEQPLFGPGGLGLDSVDALQLVVALDKNYGFKIADSAAAKELLANVSSLASGLAQHQAAKAVGA
jgi:acyl carrier protein